MSGRASSAAEGAHDSVSWRRLQPVRFSLRRGRKAWRPSTRMSTRIRRKVARMSALSTSLLDPTRRPRTRRMLRILSWLVSAALLALAAWLLHRYLGAMRWRDVATALTQLPRAHVAGAVAA